MSVVQVTTANELPTREIDIRNAIKKVINEQQEIKKLQINKIHNEKTSSRGWNRPYIYVKFVSRTHRDDETDIANFSYGYLFDIGVVSNLKSLDEDNVDDYLLNIMTIVESALSVNKTLLSNTILFHYAHETIRDDSGFTDETKHMVIRVEYTQEVPVGS